MSKLAELIEAVTRGDEMRVRSLLAADGRLARGRDETGATPLHYAAFHGQRDIVRLLLAHGAEINAVDGQSCGTPTGWAIEYLRELGGFLAIELRDLAFAIENGDVRWVARFLQRFPALRDGRDTEGRTFAEMARQSGNAQIMEMFDARE